MDLSPEKANRVASVMLAIAALVLFFALRHIVAAANLTQGGWIAIVLLAAFVLGVLTFSVFVSFPSKENVALLAVSLTLGLAVSHVVLKAFKRDLIDIVDSKVIKPLSGTSTPIKAEASLPIKAKPANPASIAAAGVSKWTSTRPPDPRPIAEIQGAVKAIGLSFSPFFNPFSLTPLFDFKLLPPPHPLGSPSSKFGGTNSVTMGCSEGDLRDYPIYRKDRYGFNNDDTIFAFKNPNMIVGGSFAMGSCVHQDETIQGVLRRNGYPIFSTGFGGAGAVGALANLKEYGEFYKPKVVLWQFYDPNDIALLTQRELRSRFLLQYLREGFTQNLINRQAELDAFWSRQDAWSKVVANYEKDPKQVAAWEQMLDTNLSQVQALLGNDIKSLRSDEDVLLVYERILALAQKRVAAWGGKIYLVMIPNMDVYSQGAIPRYKRTVASSMAKIGIPVIDVDEAITAAGDPLQFFANRSGWSHFNAEGYRLTSRQIMARLDQDFGPQLPK